MKVKPEEEGKVREAASMVNEKINAYKNQFGIDDKQDLLAMVAFDGMMKKLRAESLDVSNLQTVLSQMNSDIEEALNN